MSGEDEDRTLQSVVIPEDFQEEMKFHLGPTHEGCIRVWVGLAGP